MECCAYCTASSYAIKPFFESLRGRYHATLYRDTIHLDIPGESQETHSAAFFFSYGVVVFFNISEEKERELFEETRNFAQNHLLAYASETIDYDYGPKAMIHEDKITLPNDEALTKLAIAHGMAQSVKLDSFENAIETTFALSRHIPEDLAKSGKIGLSRKVIRRKMGELFITRNSITLHLDVLDLPDFFWEYPELEPLYQIVATDLDIQNRVEVLDRRLTSVHELYEVLGNELNHQQSCRLEWTIIWLIVIEVILTLMRDYFHLI